MIDSAMTVTFVLLLASLIVGLLSRRNSKLAMAATACGLIIAAVFAFVSDTGVTALDQSLRPGQAISWASQRWLVGKGVAISCALLLFAAELHRHLRWTMLAQLAGLVLVCGGTSPLVVLAALQLVVALSLRPQTSRQSASSDPRWGLWTGLWMTVGFVLLMNSSPSSSTESSQLTTLATVLVIGTSLAQLPLSIWRRSQRQDSSVSTFTDFPVHVAVGVFLWRLTSFPQDLGLMIDTTTAQSLLIVTSIISLLLSVVMSYRTKSLSDWANLAWLIGWGPMLALMSLSLLQSEQSAVWTSLRSWPDAASIVMGWIVWLSLGGSLLLFLEREYLIAWKHRASTSLPNETSHEHVDRDIIAGWGRQRPILGVSLTVLAFSLAGAPFTWGFWQLMVTIESLTTVRIQASLTGFIDPVVVYQFIVLLWGCALAAFWKQTYGWLVCLWADPVKASPAREQTQIRSLTCGGLAMTMVLIGLVPGPMLRLLVRCQDRSDTVAEKLPSSNHPQPVQLAHQLSESTPRHE